MTYILTNDTNYGQNWAKEMLEDVIRPGMKAVILPLSYDYGWASDARDWQIRYEESGNYHYDLFRPLLGYGLKRKDIRILDQYGDDPADMVTVIGRSDILVLVGEDPDDCMLRIEDLGLYDVIRGYGGIVIGLSAGAKIMQESYYVTPDDGMPFRYREGLGLAGGFDLDIHYRQDLYHLAGIIRSLETQQLPLIVLPERSGILILGDEVILMGEAFAAQPKDLDELYRLYEAERYRAG